MPKAMWKLQLGYGLRGGEARPPARGNVASVAGTPCRQLGNVTHTRGPHTSKPSGSTFSGTKALEKQTYFYVISINFIS